MSHLPRAALVAVGGWSFVPTLAHARSFVLGNSDLQAEICTAQGPERGAPGDSMPAGEVAGVQGHCPYCACGGTPAMLPPVAVTAALPLPPESAGPPPLFLHAPRTLFAWASAQPRAPPALS